MAASRTLLLVVVGTVLPLFGIATGFFLDDYFLLLRAEALGWSLAGLDLYVFAPGDPEVLWPFIADGPYPWWTLPELKVAFFRPLSSALLLLDHSLFGWWAPGYHLHSALWHGALVAAAAAVLAVLVESRRLQPTVGVLALLLFTVDDSHLIPAFWVANRNALVAGAFGLLGLAAHLRWRESGWRPGLPLSLAALALGLAGGEAALGCFAYIGAYEVVAGPGGWSGRLRALLAPVGLAGAYLAMHGALGYGASGADQYLDPVASPAAFLAVLPGRLAAMVGGQLLSVSPDGWVFVPSTRPLLVASGVLGVLLFGALHRWLPRPELDDETRTVGFLVLGGALALLPVAATFPTARLLLLPGLAGAVLLASLFRRSLTLGRRLPGRVGRGLVLLLLFVQLPLALLVWPVAGVWLTGLLSDARERYLASEIDDRLAPDQQVVVVAAPEMHSAFYPQPVREIDGGHPPVRIWRPLSFGPHEHRLTRIDERTFDIEVADGRWLTSLFESILRGSTHPLEPGVDIRLTDLTVTPIEVDPASGRPRRVRFRFEEALESERLLFLHWREGRLRRLELPEVGGRILLPYEPGPLPLP